MKENGFTLIELLVIVSVIGIFAAVSFIYLDGARDKGSEAGIQRNLINLRSQAAVYYDDNDGYVGLCAHTKMREMILAGSRAGGHTPNPDPYDNTDEGTWNTEACQADAERFVVWVPERASTAGTPIAWCVDSTGASRRVTGTTLPANSFSCP